MNEQQFLADLQTKVLYMGTPVLLDNSDAGASVLNKKVPIVELGLKGTAKPLRMYQYTVINAGVEPAEGLSALEVENAYAVNPIELPVGDALLAVQYLEAQKALGTWTAYEYESGRSDLGHFFAKVWVENQDGTESQKTVRVSYNAEGNPSHAEVI